MTDSTRPPSQGTPVAMLHRWENFCAAHRLYDEQLSAEENERLYGVCAREFGHGHNYRLRVTVRGQVDQRTGMIINLTTIKDAMRELIVDQLDHRHLNHTAPLMQGINPTAENLAVVCWNVLYQRFGELLYEILIEETPNNLVSYRGECV